MSVYVDACVFLCPHLHKDMHTRKLLIVPMQPSICQCRCVHVGACVFVPLLSAEPPWDEGEEEEDELEEVLCSMASRESSERRRSGLLKQEEHIFSIIQHILSIDTVCMSHSAFNNFCSTALLRASPGPYELRTCARAQTYSSIRGILPNQGWGDWSGPLGDLDTHKHTDRRSPVWV